MDVSQSNNQPDTGHAVPTAEEGKLRLENLSMISDLNTFLKRNKLLALKRSYVNFKYTEYGDFSRVDEIYDALSSTFISARKEAAQLKADYEKAIEDIETIPTACNSIGNTIDDIENEVSIARNEVDEILEAFPNLEARAEACRTIQTESAAARRQLEDNSRRQGGLKHEFQTRDGEKQNREKQLADKKKILAPLVESETELNETLAEIADRFERQETFTQEKQLAEESIGSLEKKIATFEEMILAHDTELAEKNQTIAALKDESTKLAAGAKEYEAKLIPFRELTDRLQKAREEVSSIDGQREKITEETEKLRKENEILGTKAKQFGILTKKLEGLR